MVNLTGLGCFVWQLHMCEDGNIAKIIDRAHKAGFNWLCVHGGEKHLDPQFTSELVSGFEEAEITPALWWYSHPSSVDYEIEYLTDLIAKTGVQHLVMDAEEPWEREPTDWKVTRNWKAEALQFATKLRAAVGPDVYLADAPWARPKSHGSPFPYNEFGSVMNARMPQFYWELAEKHGESYTHFVSTADLEWAQTGLPGTPICPIGSCVDEFGQMHCPVSELNEFLDRYQNRQACSIWSWQHLNSAEWELLYRRAELSPPVYVSPTP